MFYYFIRKLLFLIDPEKAHMFTLKQLRSKKIQFLKNFFLSLKSSQKI